VVFAGFSLTYTLRELTHLLIDIESTALSCVSVYIALKIRKLFFTPVILSSNHLVQHASYDLKIPKSPRDIIRIYISFCSYFRRRYFGHFMREVYHRLLVGLRSTNL
jgi:hypothetical protein